MGLNTAPEPPDRSLGQLFGDLSSQASRLIHDEVELAKIEMTEKAQSLSIVGAYVAAAAVGALLFLGTLTAMLTLVLAKVVDAWIAAAIVAAAWLVIAAALVLLARARYQRMQTPLPEQTIETVKEDIQWAKDPTRSARSERTGLTG